VEEPEAVEDQEPEASEEPAAEDEAAEEPAAEDEAETPEESDE